MTPSRRVLRRSRTRPAPSRPTMLQLFLPKSTPRMRTSFMPPSYRHPVMVEERGGPFHKGGLRSTHPAKNGVGRVAKIGDRCACRHQFQQQLEALSLKYSSPYHAASDK